jgi:hypothetical protein
MRYFVYIIIGILLCSPIVFSENINAKIQSISIFDLMNKTSWEEYKDHIQSCEICCNITEKYKMCPQCYYLVESARPYISNDQMKLIALGELEIITPIKKD